MEAAEVESIKITLERQEFDTLFTLQYNIFSTVTTTQRK